MTPEFIQQGMFFLCEVDPDIHNASKEVGFPQDRSWPKGFETLVSIVISQQLSAQVARVLMARLRKLSPQMSPSEIMQLDESTLRDAGLSRRKIEYIRGLAEAILQGRFDPGQLEQLSEQEAFKQITALRGFGPWSAEIYLMFAMNKTDIFPVNDLALQVAVQRLKSLSQKPDVKQTGEIAAQWSPWRSIAALFLWHYYRGMPAG